MTDMLGTPAMDTISGVYMFPINLLPDLNAKYHCIIRASASLFAYQGFPLTFQVRNEKARRYLSTMRKKQPVPMSHKFPNADPLALRLLQRLLAFDPKDRPTAEEVCYEI